MDRGLETNRRLFRQRRKPLHGFTLIELLIVIAIVALLIGILLPVLSAARKAGQAAVCLSNVRQIATAANVFATDNRQFLFPASQMYMGAPYYRTLQEGGYLDDGSDVHLCPNDDDPNDGWEADLLGDGVRTTSYAINGYFAPNHDPYGDPPMMHGGTNNTIGEFGIRLEDVRSPSQKVFSAEIADDKDRDHFMPMYWGTGAAIHPNPASGMFMMARMSEIDAGNGNIPRVIERDRHSRGADFAFADGHGAHHAFTDTWGDTIADRADRDANHKTDWYDPLY